MRLELHNARAAGLFSCTLQEYESQPRPAQNFMSRSTGRFVTELAPRHALSTWRSLVSNFNEGKIMTNERLNGKKIAILATEGFEQPELEKPREALDKAGAKTEIVSPKAGQIRAWDTTDWGETFDVDVKLDHANPEDYDGLLLP